MGILYNALNTLIGETVGLGFDQLDNWFDRMAAEGKAEEAAAALDQATADQQEYLRQTLSGQRGVLPKTNPNVLQNPYTGQVFTYQQNQMIQNNPDVIAAEQARKQQEEITKARAGAFEGLARQRDVGTETIGPGIMGKMDFTAPQLQESHATGLGMGTTAQYKAAEPFKEKAMSRSIQLKQTPTYAQAIGGGNGGGTRNAISPSFQGTVVNNLMKRYPAMFRQQAVDETGKPAINMSTYLPVYEPNAAALQVAQEIADEYARTKKPNYMKIETQAVQRFKKGQGDEMSQMPPKPTALQNLPRPQPKSEPKTTPLPRAIDNLPKAQPTQPATPSQPTVTAIQMTQAIARMKAAGEPPAKIKQMIESRGFNPKNFGF